MRPAAYGAGAEGGAAGAAERDPGELKRSLTPLRAEATSVPAAARWFRRAREVDEPSSQRRPPLPPLPNLPSLGLRALEAGLEPPRRPELRGPGRGRRPSGDGQAGLGPRQLPSPVLQGPGPRQPLRPAASPRVLLGCQPGRSLRPRKPRGGARVWGPGWPRSPAAGARAPGRAVGFGAGWSRAAHAGVRAALSPLTCAARGAQHPRVPVNSDSLPS